MTFPRYPKYKDSGVEWLGQVPEHWVVSSFRHSVAAMFNGITADQIDEREDTVPVTRIESISSGTLDESRLGFIDKANAREDRLLLAGDILFSNINSLNMIGNCAYYPGGRQIYAGMNLLVFRPARNRLPQWLFWLIRSPGFRETVESLAKPAINQASVSQSSINAIPIATPPFNEQKQIAAFLEHEAAKTDALVAEQQLLIDLLAEKRQVVISHAVIKGLNSDAPARPSGVVWLGNVPAHWGVRRLRFVCDIATGDADTTDASDDGEVPFFVRSQTVERIDRHTHDCEAVLTAGDGVGVGKVFHHFKGRFRAHQRVYIFSNFTDVSGRFFFLYLKENFYKVALEGGAKSTVDSLRRPVIANFWITIPPADEQAEIVEECAAQSERFDALIAEAQRAIALLQERRAALISAAVTGQIDVRHLAPSESS